MASKPRVLIIGGGLGGLVLAQTLRKQGIPFTVFERDTDDHSRVQGWAITLSVALPGLRGDFVDDMPPISNVSISKNLHTVGAEFNIYDGLTGEKFPIGIFKGPVDADSADPNAPFRANRRHYREWLTSNLDIHWNKRFTYYTESANGVTAFFSDGTSYDGDILVGADGINSHVRSELFGQNVGKAWLLPYACIVADVVLDEEATKRQMALSQGMYNVKGKGYQVFCSYRSVEAGMKSSEWYWFMLWEDRALLKPDFWMNRATSQELLDKARERVQDFTPELRSLVELTSATGVHVPALEFKEFYPPYGIPTGRVTVLGDALHGMCPFRGLGANTASLDGLELGQAIAKSSAEGSDLIEALRLYGEKAARRGKMLVNESHDIGAHLDAKTHVKVYAKAMAKARGDA